MAGTSVVRGKRLRVSRVGDGGLPQAGKRSTIVTKGFITVSLNNNMKDADDIEQLNADGQVCVSDSTPPEVKWVDVEIEFCKVDPELFSFFTDDPLVLDYKNDPVGFRKAKSVKADKGAAVELWTGTGDDERDVPTDDSIFEGTGETTVYGYFLLPWIKHGVLSDIEIGSEVATFTITGRTAFAPYWGRGPYKVVPQDSKGTPGRLLTPIGKDEHFHFERTTVAPPKVTDGPTELSIPEPYFVKSELPNAPIGDLIDAGDNLPGGLVDDDGTSDDSSSGLDVDDSSSGLDVDDSSNSGDDLV